LDLEAWLLFEKTYKS